MIRRILRNVSPAVRLVSGVSHDEPLAGLVKVYREQRLVLACTNNGTDAGVVCRRHRPR